MAYKIIPVILSGGSGTRLWPLSRATYPKQFLSFADSCTLFQNTVKRLNGIQNVEQPIIICNDEHRFIVAEQLRTINTQAAEIILEPIGRNTAAAATIASLLMQNTPNAVIALFPADQIIEKESVFDLLIQQAASLAKQGYIVTLGINPLTPHTGFGYIKKGAAINADSEAFLVEQFTEKPDPNTAQIYINSQQYFWNSGIFFFHPDTLIQELKLYQPEILKFCQEALRHAKKDLDFTRLESSAFLQVPNISLDYSIMEKTKNAVVIPTTIKWNDLGSWQALWEYKEKDQNGNYTEGDVLSINTQNCFLHSNSRLIAAAGVQDLTIIETEDAVLVTPRQENETIIKQLTTHLEKQNRKEIRENNCQYRPWGYFKTLDLAENFQVKFLFIKPGGRLSLQLHHHRAEHWVIVSGTAKVTCGEEIKTLTANQSTYIPVGIKHRIENPGKTPLKLIEVQSGHYLGEDDIIRFEDDYKRIESNTKKTEDSL